MINKQLCLLYSFFLRRDSLQICYNSDFDKKSLINQPLYVSSSAFPLFIKAFKSRSSVTSSTELIEAPSALSSVPHPLQLCLLFVIH